VNSLPSVSLTSPTGNASFKAPANIPLAVQVADADGSIANVEFFHGTTLITALSASPYSFVWTEVPQGTYALTARVTDNLGGAMTSVAVTVTVNAAEAKLYYIHVDHLNTPRLITDANQQTVWRNDNTEPFGDSPPDENPSGLGVFEFPFRFDGTYADKETGLLQNWRRELDKSRGQYLQSDPLGLRAGMNTYTHLLGNPLSYTDLEGLLVQLLCRPVTGLPIKSHCFVWVTCPAEGWDFTLSLFGNAPYINSTGYKRISTSRDPTNQDNPNSAAVNYRQTINPSPDACNKDCAFEKSILNRFDQAPLTAPYGGLANNSNTFAQDLVTSGAFGTSLPSNVPPSAPGFTPMVGGRIR
jgi:RHS repeat-associated protein